MRLTPEGCAMIKEDKKIDPLYTVVSHFKCYSRNIALEMTHQHRSPASSLFPFPPRIFRAVSLAFSPTLATAAVPLVMALVMAVVTERFCGPEKAAGADTTRRDICRGWVGSGAGAGAGAEPGTGAGASGGAGSGARSRAAARVSSS
jgi:hypothetical protein